MTQPALDFNPRTATVAPSPSPAARQTSALAAIANHPRRGTQNELIYRIIKGAGSVGISDPELAAFTGLLRSTICARRRDLAAFIIAAERRAKSPYGVACTCWRLRTPEEMGR